MKGVNFVKDENGNNTALLIDLQAFKNSGKTGKDVSQLIEAIENIEDTIDIELSKGQSGKPYSEVRAELIKKGKLKA